jgi:hypothetical protein
MLQILLAGCDGFDTKPVEFGRLRERFENPLLAWKSA